MVSKDKLFATRRTNKYYLVNTKAVINPLLSSTLSIITYKQLTNYDNINKITISNSTSHY